MGETEQTFMISCKGGLDLTSNSQDLLQKPGWATRLINFEPSLDGGYRRISGYQQAGTGRTPDATESPILGIKMINNKFIVVCHEDAVWITFDLDTFVQVNKAGASTGVNLTTLNAAAAVPRPNVINYDFEVFRLGTTVTVVGTSDGNNPFYLQVDGDDAATATYTYKDITVLTGSLSGANRCEKYKDQLVIAGMDTAPTEIYYSDILKPDDFEGANAGSIGLNDVVTGLKMFREVLYVFCKNSIHRIIGISEGSPQRQPVTRNIGCVNGETIQEIGGDLVFLAPDGFRTLSATDRIGDVNLNALSSPIANRVRTINKEIDNYQVRSEVIKSKLQYRCFIKPKPGETGASFSFIMFMGLGEAGFVPEFSQLSGFDIEAIDNDYYEDRERTLSGDSKGNLWWHGEGVDFNGTQIPFLYQTPFFSINDPVSRKNIHELLSYLKVEGDTDFFLAIKYDFDAPEAYNPAPYRVGPLKAPAIYGETKYTINNVEYGKTSSPVWNTLTEGSGKTMAIRIYPSGERCDPFSLQGWALSYIQSGRI